MEIRAPMVGTIREILVQTGMSVAPESEILVIESMKMQIPITASRAGTVSAIAVQEGQVVQEGDLLMTIS